MERIRGQTLRGWNYLFFVLGFLCFSLFWFVFFLFLFLFVFLLTIFNLDTTTFDPGFMFLFYFGSSKISDGRPVPPTSYC